jgi:hypothetical protein
LKQEKLKDIDYNLSTTRYSSPVVSAKNETTFIFDNRIWVDSKEAADYLRISYGALRNAVYRKQIIPRKFRRRLYFKVSELNRLLENSIAR